jgi:hypothetical protein
MFFFCLTKEKGRPHAGLCVNGPQRFYTSMNQTQKYAAKVLNSLRLEGVSAQMINYWIVFEKFVDKKVKMIYCVLTGGKTLNTNPPTHEY